MINSDNVASLIGASVLGASDNKIGTVGQVYVDPADGRPNWMTVRTGLFGSSESFVPLDQASWDDENVHVNFEKDFIKDAPRIDTDGALSPSDEDELYRYYSMGDSAGTTDSSLSGTQTGADYAGADYVGRNDTGTDSGTVGRDTSGPTTDSAMTRSEEQLNVDTEKVETGRARLRKYVVTENQSVTVPVTHEEVRLDREPITDANAGDATSGPDISEEEHEVTLTEERVVVNKETVPVERVRLDKETVTEQEEVNEEVRKEQIELDDDGTGRSGAAL